MEPNEQTKRLHQWIQNSWKSLLEDCPEMATMAGEAGHGHRWSDCSLEALETRKQRTRQNLSETGSASSRLR